MLRARLEFELGGVALRADASAATAERCALAVAPFEPLRMPRAFGIGRASAAPVCTVAGGANVNCYTLSCCAHACGTHTETAAHVARAGRPTLMALDAAEPIGAPCAAAVLALRAVPLRESGDAESQPGECKADAADRVYSAEAARQAAARAAGALAALAGVLPGRAAEAMRSCGAVMLRTQAEPGGYAMDYSGSNPPYLTQACVRTLRELFPAARHLVTELPSVDREDDGGPLAAHREWFGLPARSTGPTAEQEERAGTEAGRTITEMAKLSACEEGVCVLALQVAPVDMDAAPSAPMVWKVEAVA